MSDVIRISGFTFWKDREGSLSDTAGWWNYSLPNGSNDHVIGGFETLETAQSHAARNYGFTQ